MTRIEISIDELVLWGVPAGQADAVSRALQERLEALAAADPEAVRALTGTQLHDIRPQRVAVLSGDADALGGAVAGTVWGAVTAHQSAGSPTGQGGSR